MIQIYDLISKYQRTPDSKAFGATIENTFTLFEDTTKEYKFLQSFHSTVWFYCFILSFTMFTVYSALALRL